MMYSFRQWLKYSVVVFCVTASSIGAAESADQTFPKNEVVDLHKSFNERYGHFSGKLSITTMPGSRKSLPQTDVSFETTTDYPRALQFSTNRHGTKVFGVNPAYCFRLTMNDREQWEINDVIKMDDSRFNDWPLADSRERDSRERTPGQLVRTGFLGFHTIGGIEIAGLIDQPEFKVVSFSDRTIDNIRKAELVYSYEPKVPPDGVSIRSGKLVFLPDNFWVVERAEVYGAIPQIDNDRWLTIVENTFTFSEGFPIIEKSTHAIADADNSQNIRFTHVYKYNISEKTETSPKFYTLSHFGFPEPDFGGRDVSWLRYVFMTAGVLLILFGLYLHWFAKKK